MTNAVSTLTATGPGYIQGDFTWTISATDFSGIDLNGCGRGAQLRSYQWLNVAWPFAGSQPFNRWNETVYELRDIYGLPDRVCGDGDFGTRKLTDGTDTAQHFASWDWQDAFENLASDTPLAPPAFVAVFRRTLSAVGTRVGSRQSHGML